MRSSLLTITLLLLLLSDTADAKKRKRKPKGKAEEAQEAGFNHPQAPKFEQIKEEDIPPGTKIKKIREGEVLDLSENARKESERKFPPHVEHMFDAVMSDDFATLNKVIMEEKVDVNVRGPNGYTALFQAVFSHKLNSVHMLLEAGADPRFRNNQGYNALDAGAYGGCVQCVRMLLQHGGVNPHLIGRDGYNALHRALWGEEPEHTEAAELLLEAGLSPSKVAVVPGQGELAPIDMVQDNDATLRLVKRWLAKEKAASEAAAARDKARKAESAKADALFGSGSKKDEL